MPSGGLPIISCAVFTAVLSTLFTGCPTGISAVGLVGCPALSIFTALIASAFICGLFSNTIPRSLCAFAKAVSGSIPCASYLFMLALK